MGAAGSVRPVALLALGEGDESVSAGALIGGFCWQCRWPRRVQPSAVATLSRLSVQVALGVLATGSGLDLHLGLLWQTFTWASLALAASRRLLQVDQGGLLFDPAVDIPPYLLQPR